MRSQRKRKKISEKNHKKMITTEKKSNKIQYKLKFIKCSKGEIFSSNHNVFCDFYMDLHYINSVGKVRRSRAISGKKYGL